MMDDFRYIADELGIDNQAFAGKVVLLTGSEGFLGRLFVGYFRYLNEKVLVNPVRVIQVDVVEKDVWRDSDYWRCDIVDEDHLSNFLSWYPGEIDFILNCAGLASPKAYSTYPLETVRVSVQGTENMLKLCEEFRVQSALFFSSSEIYGNPSVVPTPESYLGGIETFCERGCYDVSKLQLENLCYIYNTRRNVNVKVARPFNVVGPLKGSDGRVIPGHVERLLKGEKMRVFLPGDQTRTFCWFSDFIVGAVKVLLHGDNRPYNIGNPANTISMVDLAHKLEVIAGLKDVVELIQPSEVYKTEPMRRVPDITRARQLGYGPKVGLDEMLGKFWGWAKENYPKS